MAGPPARDDETTIPDPPPPDAASGSWRRPLAGIGRVRPPRYSAIWVATGLLFAFSPLLASNSLTKAALLSMLPFAALLAIASVGQTLVIQQRGLDLTVPGMILLTTVILTQHAAGHGSRLPLVATLGVNALLIGTVYQLTSGQATATSPAGLVNFASHKTLGIPNTAVIAVIAVVIAAILLRTTVLGRRFVAVGASPAAARAAGIRVNVYLVTTYVLASLAYGLTGILFAGYFSTPGLSAGSDYLLPTIAAVVLGGTSLAGGTGSVIATAVGAVFLTQLQQILTANGAALSVEYIIQGSIIAAGMLLRNVPWRRLWAHIAAGMAPPAGGSAQLAAAMPEPLTGATAERES